MRHFTWLLWSGCEWGIIDLGLQDGDALVLIHYKSSYYGA